MLKIWKISTTLRMFQYKINYLNFIFRNLPFNAITIEKLQHLNKNSQIYTNNHINVEYQQKQQLYCQNICNGEIKELTDLITTLKQNYFYELIKAVLFTIPTNYNPNILFTEQIQQYNENVKALHCLFKAENFTKSRKYNENLISCQNFQNKCSCINKTSVIREYKSTRELSKKVDSDFFLLKVKSCFDENKLFNNYIEDIINNIKRLDNLYKFNLPLKIRKYYLNGNKKSNNFSLIELQNFISNKIFSIAKFDFILKKIFNANILGANLLSQCFKKNLKFKKSEKNLSNTNKMAKVTTDKTRIDISNGNGNINNDSSRVGEIKNKISCGSNCAHHNLPSSSKNTDSSEEKQEKGSCFTSNLSDIIKFLELVGGLKHTKRTGFVLRDVKNCESISGHMYRMAMMTFLLDGSEGLNQTKCMELALVHDLAECIVGDLTPFCGVTKEDKKRMEMEAMEKICKLIEPRGKRMWELFVEYETGESAESKFVKDLDRLDMILQAFEYEKRDDCLMKHQEFFDSTEGKFEHNFVQKLVKEIYDQREKLATERGCTANMYPKPILHQNGHHENGINGISATTNGIKHSMSEDSISEEPVSAKSSMLIDENREKTASSSGR